MAIVPAGKMRLMEAQNIDDPLYDPSSPEESLEIKPEEENLSGIGAGVVPEGKPEIEPKKIEEPGKETLSDYIFKKLQSFGYPGRRLEEFKKKFVVQEVAVDGTENIKIEIPDKHYPDPATGETKTIESKDLSEIVREIGRLFGLNFMGAHRSEGKWSIDFTSAKPSEDEQEKSVVKDNLDEVYGVPSKSKKSRPVHAFTIYEMIKGSKDGLAEKLKKILS